MFDLTGKTALVTGASGGIGRAVAVALAGRGARVALSGTRIEALEAVRSELGGDHVVLAANLSEPAEADGLVPRAEEALGRLDILVNNAGITRDGLALRMKDADWQAVIDVNLGATFRLCRAALKNMMRQRWGRVVNVTSIVGTTGNPGQANYAAAKAGIVGMTKSLAAEAASRNVTINCLAPGFVETAMTDVLNEQQRTGLMGRIPMGRMGKPEDVAAGVVYLSSDEAAYVTGHTLHINGGMAMV